MEVDPVVGSDGMTIDVNLALSYSAGKPEVRKIPIVTAGGAKVEVESVDVDQQTLSAAVTLFDDVPGYLGAMKAADGRTVLVFLRATRKPVEREPVLPE